jgi:hypothetical protein
MSAALAATTIHDFDAAIRQCQAKLGDKAGQIQAHLAVLRTHASQPPEQQAQATAVFWQRTRSALGSDALLAELLAATRRCAAQRAAAPAASQPPVPAAAWSPFQLPIVQQPVPAAVANQIFQQLLQQRQQLQSVLRRLDQADKRAAPDASEPPSKRQRCECECVVCLDAEPAVVLVPCGHLCLCQSCADLLRAPQCPICRAAVLRAQPVLRP